MGTSAVLLGQDAEDGSGVGKEILDDRGHQATFFGLGGFADDGGQVQLPLGQSFESGVGDLPEGLGIDLRDEAVLDCVLRLVVEVHLADHPLELVGGEDTAHHVEDLARALRLEIVFDLYDAIEQLIQNTSFADIRRHGMVTR